MKLNNIVKIALISFALTPLSSCNDFFEPENKTVKSGENYIMEEGEMYSGFVGLVTKLQAIGDKSIYITDTRAEVLEPTDRSIELKQLYDYESDLAGNTYADPAKYYDVIIACNDYLQKAYEFKQANSSSVNMEHYRGFIGGTLRLKAWTYFTMGKIYGKAIWFDDPMLEMKDYSQYPVKNLDQIIESCTTLLEQGFDGVNGTYEMPWTKWITEIAEENVNVNDYYYWDIMIPQYFILSAEIALWKGNYQRVVDLILPQVNEAFAATSGNFTKWMLTSSYYNSYSGMFDNLAPTTNVAVSVIRYNYEKNQTNQLLKHFTNEYLLRPSVAGVERYSDPDFHPQTATKVDHRLVNYFFTATDGTRYFHKYRKRSGSRRPNVLQDDVFIYLYRSVDLYLMLIEAFNHLNRFDEMDMLMNTGAYAVSVNNPPLWQELLTKGYTTRWVNAGNAASNQAVRSNNLPRPLRPTDTEENRRYNDMEILHEIILEFPGEGKTYPAMIRMARRYNDPGIIADIVTEKYANPAQQASIRAKILAGEYFVNWDYNNASTAIK